MQEDNNTPAVTGDPELSSAEGGNVNPTAQEDLVNDFNKATGRNFKTIDDVKKSMKDSFDFISQLGDIKEKAQKYDQIEEEKNRTPEQVNDERYNKIDKLDFLYQHPEAKDVVDDVADIARSRNISFVQAYETSSLKKVVDKQAEEEKAQSPDFVDSNQRIVGGKAPLSTDDFTNLPLEEQRKIITQLPSWRTGFGKTSISSSRKTG